MVKPCSSCATCAVAPPEGASLSSAAEPGCPAASPATAPGGSASLRAARRSRRAAICETCGGVGAGRGAAYGCGFGRRCGRGHGCGVDEAMDAVLDAGVDEAMDAVLDAGVDEAMGAVSKVSGGGWPHGTTQAWQCAGAMRKAKEVAPRFGGFLNLTGRTKLIPRPEIHAAAAERASERQAWPEAMENLAPLEFNKPQLVGRMTWSSARRGGRRNAVHLSTLPLRDLVGGMRGLASGRHPWFGCSDVWNCGRHSGATGGRGAEVILM
eukprot:350199-Chlamydomonas_euryale.AAC.2